METAARHWEGVYADKDSTEVSWYQADAGVSLDLITKHAGADVSTIDIGAGASYLVDCLWDAGSRDLSVLDISTDALEVVRARLGPRSDEVTFIVADLLTWVPDRTFNTWHDRAVFHFLTESGDRDAYLRTASIAVEQGGLIVLGTFAPDGPEQCSGLPTARYDSATLAQLFAPTFTLIESQREIHRTPWDTEQAFTWVVLRKQ